MRFLVLSLLFLLPVLMVSAQSPLSLRGKRWYAKGQEYVRKRNDAKAESFFLKSLRQDPHFVAAYAELGRLYLDKGQFTKAADLFKEATRRCPEGDHAFALPLARALNGAQRYEQAEAVLHQWKPPAGLPDPAKQEYELLRRSIRFGKYAIHAPHTDTPQNMGSRINTAFDEYFPSVSPDDSILVFTHRNNGVDEDFFIARRDSCGGWFQARDLGAPPNSTQQEGAQMRSADGRYLFFMRCGNRSANGWEAGGCDLYFSYIDDWEWVQPVPFGATINTPAYEGMPSLSSDNRTLYFVSDRAGGYGGKDIWRTRFEQGLWQIPENLGPEINTPFDETAPFIAADNKTLYFTSNGHAGMGGHDVFYSRLSPNGQWQRPENMGYPFNTAYDDVSACLSWDGQRAYLASDRPGGYGRMDLYEVNLPPAARPEAYTFVYGKVSDSLDGVKIPYAQLEFSDAVTGQPLCRYQSNSGDASYTGALPLGRDLALRVYRAGYLDYLDTLYFEHSPGVYPDTLPIVLLPNDYQPALHDSVLLVLNFKKNIVEINDSDKVVLKELIQPFLGRPFVSFRVHGYTDDSGTPYINEELSFTRARTVAAWLQALGVAEDRIQTQGWADANPLAPNDTEANRDLNRRVELVLRHP